MANRTARGRHPLARTGIALLAVAVAGLAAARVAERASRPVAGYQRLGWVRRQLTPRCEVESPFVAVRMSPRTGAYTILDRVSGEIFRQGARGEGFARAKVAGRRVRLDRPRALAVAADRFELEFSVSPPALPASRGSPTPEPVGLRCALLLVDGGRTVEKRCETDGSTSADLEMETSLTLAPVRSNAVLLPLGPGRRLAADTEGEWVWGVHRGPGHFTMPMLGVVQATGALVQSWDDLDAEVRVTSARSAGSAGPRGARFVSQVWARGATRLTVCGTASDDALGACMRDERARRSPLPGWSDRLEQRPGLRLLGGAFLTKVFIEHGIAADAAINHEGRELHAVARTFDEVVELIRHLRDDLGIERNLLELGGWGRGGYDFAHPDVWPPDAAAGGPEGLARVVGAATRAAWLVALHDNYDMAVQRSPTFDPADAIGAANRWAGGPHWQIHPARQWRYAERNLDSILAVTRPTAYFIDATTALPLPEASAATPDLTRSGAIDAFRDLARRVSERIGPVGSEDGQEWALGAFDWFEGMLSDSRFGEVGEPWPLFELAHHQDAALFWHQSETLGLPGPRADWARSRSSASDLLELLSFARTPLFTPPPGERWWWQEASSRKASGDDARNPFVRGDGGWGDGRHPLDVLLKNTYEVLSPVSELASALPLVGHEARPDGVVRTVFGDGRADSARRVEVLVNRGTQPLHVPEGELPPGVGFVVRAPTFVAFHATRWRGVDYGSGGALFTVRSLDQAPLERSREVRVWHGFGASTLALGGPEREPRARTIPAEGVVLDPTER